MVACHDTETFPVWLGMPRGQPIATTEGHGLRAAHPLWMVDEQMSVFEKELISPLCWRRTLGVPFCHSLLSPLRQGLSLTLLLAHIQQGHRNPPVSVHHSSLGYRCVYNHAWLLKKMLGI